MFDSDRISISWFYVSTSVINWSISNDIVRHRHMHMWHVQCMCTLYALSLTLLHFVHNLFSKEVKEPWQNAKLNNVLCTLKLDRINVLKKNKIKIKKSDWIMNQIDRATQHFARSRMWPIDEDRQFWQRMCLTVCLCTKECLSEIIFAGEWSFEAWLAFRVDVVIEISVAVLLQCCRDPGI